MATAFSSETPPKQHPPQMVDLVLEYARQGFSLFPLSPDTKVPLKDSHGVSEATTDEAKIRAWWEEHPRANIAFAGGDGLVFIDEDTYKGADISIWTPPPTKRVRSARGGTHHYFHYEGVLPCVNEGILAPGICIKATGGYVVAPGSIVKGKRYEWVDEHQPIAELPERIAEMIRNATMRPETAPEAQTAQNGHARYDPSDIGDYWLEKAMARTGDGLGNAMGYWLGQQLHIEARHGAAVDIKAILREYARRATVNPRDPFTERNVETWYTSSGKSRLAQNGTPARPRIHVVPPSNSKQDAPAEDSSDASAQDDTGKNDEPTEKESQQDVLIRLGLTAATLFRTPRGSFHAAVDVNGCREVYSLPERGGDFRAWLVNEYGKMYNRAPSSSAITQAMDFFRARARFAGEVHEVYTRVAQHAGKLYIDIGSATWECIEVDVHGWRVIPQAPVYFRRPDSMGALPHPVHGGTVNELRPFVNVKTDDQWHLAVGWLLGTLHPSGPYAHCELSGPQGSAKTSATRYMRGIVDPGKPAVRRAPKDPDDFMIGASNSWVLALDNLSSIPDWLSDQLATLATGAGTGKRTLYTDAGETIFDARRPAIFNGIADLATRGDLQERTVRIELTRPAKRQTEAKIDAAYAKVQPRIFGALLDAVSCALRRLPTIECDLPRMADFAQWVTAAEPALGWEPGTFLQVFGANQADSAGTVFDADPVAQAVRAFMADKDEWRGRASELLNMLSAHAPHGPDAPNWPKGANSLVTKIKRIMPALAVASISAEVYRTREGSIVTLTKTPTCDDPSDGDRHTSSQGSSHAHPSPNAGGDDRDGCDDVYPTSLFQRHPQATNKEVDIRISEKGQEEARKSGVGEGPSQSSQPSQPPNRACIVCREQRWIWNGRQWVCGNNHAESEK